FGQQLAEVDPLHGGAEAFLTLSNALVLPAPENLADQWQASLDHPGDPERIQALSAGAERHRLVLERLSQRLSRA
ncbi:MAG: DUF3593 domain-containing protein, partial [Cyanobium sp.]